MTIHRFSWKDKPYNPENKPRVCVVRLGAFGDIIQASSVCASLKKAGFHVTLMATHPASELLAFDPNVDEMLVQLVNQVPNHWLGMYWKWMRDRWRGKPFDRWVNLTESVEANLLAMDHSVAFEWPAAVRHKHMNWNYLQRQHELAGVPYEPTSKFYATDEEKAWAKREYEKMRKVGIHKVIMWGLAGSSRTHKVWPHMADIWRHLFKHYPGWGVVTTGDGSCADLEAGFEGEPRLWRTSGKWTIRQVLAFMEGVDCVVGPETGLMSVAAFYDIPKIVFLSHSSVENLTRDWPHTTSFWAPETRCPGRGNNEAPACHRMLPTFNGCRRNEDFGVAQCTVEIRPEWVWEHLQRVIREGTGGTWHPPLLA